MKCDKCNSTQDFSNFIVFKNDEERINVCVDCLKKLGEEGIEDLKMKGFKASTISRCSSYDDCMEIGNLRKKCEELEPIEKEYNLYHPFSMYPPYFMV